MSREVRMDAVHDQRVDRVLAVGQSLREVLGLLDRVAPGRGDEHERGLVGGQQLASPAWARSRKPSSMPSKARKNDDDVVDRFGADDA